MHIRIIYVHRGDFVECNVFTAPLETLAFSKIGTMRIQEHRWAAFIQTMATPTVEFIAHF